MPIKYATLGSDRQLNQIEMAGSHDAGITSGASNVRAQGLDIGSQAAAGVRVFDLRIAASMGPASHASGGVLKAVMPNIVMIDFADEGKCQHIYNLNHMAATAHADAVRAVDREVEEARRACAQLQKNMGRRVA